MSSCLIQRNAINVICSRLMLNEDTHPENCEWKHIKLLKGNDGYRTANEILHVWCDVMWCVMNAFWSLLMSVQHLWIFYGLSSRAHKRARYLVLQFRSSVHIYKCMFICLVQILHVKILQGSRYPLCGRTLLLGVAFQQDPTWCNLVNVHWSASPT
jgi:hypothetical protein